MTWDQQGGAGGSGGGGFTPPPWPSQPPAMPPFAPSVPPAPADPLRAVAVGLLNLSGLGIGYALIRRWLALAVSLVATGILLLIALPATSDGVSGGVVIAYSAFLALAAAHGAYRGLRSRLSWPSQAPLALVLGLVLLAAPVGGVALYDGARDEATQKMLLDRLDKADQLVQAAKAKPFEAAQTDYTTALAAYRDLNDHHRDSRAAKRVPDRLDTYYKTIGAPYDQQKYCEAVAPLKYLRMTVPQHYAKKDLGSLATWPDDRLATSLYECGIDGLTQDTTAPGDDSLSELLYTFPKSPQAAKVEPAVKSAIDEAGKGVRGSDPCAATDRVRTLGVHASGLPGKAAGVSTALGQDARRADAYVQSGSYACAVHAYTSGDFKTAVDKMNDFIGKYPKDKNRTLAKKVVIAAQVAQEVPAAGKHLPTTASGGSISVTVSNDSPDQVEVLFTGPVTGSFTLKGCGACKTYSSEASAQTSACNDSSKNYPKRTIHLPTGTTYFLHKSTSGSSATPGTDTAKLRSGYIYTECAYVVSGSAFDF